MIKFLEHLFKSKKSTFKYKKNFKNLISNKETQKLFSLFNSFSKDSELRFVGGCLRKIIKDEKVIDIDLSTNLKPSNVVELLKKIKLNFMRQN